MSISSKNRSKIMNLLDPDEFRRQGHMIIDFLADYYENIEKYPVVSRVEPGYLSKCLPDSAPSDQESIETILHDIDQYIVPGLTHWQSPNFFAYFQTGFSIPGMLGEMLCSGFNVAGFNWFSSPAATELESLVMDWLGKLLDLPTSFLFSGHGGGVIQGNTCEAIICTLTSARDKILRRLGQDSITKLVVYGSDQTHCSFQKAARIVGIDPQNFRTIKTTWSTSFGLSPDSLRNVIYSDIDRGLIPLYLCATVGTTAITAVDPLTPLCKIANEFGMWVHVDAAYAGASCICPEYRKLINGVELADSFSFNAHKWLLTPLDCCCLWLKDPSALVKSLSTDPEYLKNEATDSKQVVDYKDWQLSLSRRFRALKLWLVLRSYGEHNLRNHIRNHCGLAKFFGELVVEDGRFEIAFPRHFAMICFRIHPSAVIDNMTIGHVLENRHGEAWKAEEVNRLNARLLEAVNASGRAFMTHALVGGIYAIRFCVGGALVTERHVAMAWKVVQEHANSVLASARHAKE
ncbi:phenylacetaldehyde synthase-like [Rhodamnia argentea]|uniref:Phenylacetaldehyde synthase-like n=1 Tax=Rhodamnia argentea TaxID=178133 RepID=A0A8B8N1E2_9MYRT|nr:phenylacetaldehyde synthase-like [Rhodamnia argentea]